MVFLDEILKAAVNMFLDHGHLVVEVLVHSEAVRCHDIVPWVVCRNIVGTVPVESGPWVRSCGVIVNHVNDDCYAACMALVNEFLIHFTCSVCLVKSEISYRSVSPAVISLELLDRHKLDGVDSKIFQIIKLGHRAVEVTCSREVTKKKLVDHEIVIICNFKIVMLP